MEQIRKANFSYNIKVDESIQTENVFLPPMLIQPFIENALWHGTSNIDEHIEINVNFTTENNHLLCTVEDNGIGIEASLKQKKEHSEMQSDYHSLGITNVKQRIQLLNEKYSSDSKLSIEDKSNLPTCKTTGTIVTLYMPFKLMNYENVTYDISG
jgi:sensor histidine kinase YesM